MERNDPDPESEAIWGKSSVNKYRIVPMVNDLLDEWQDLICPTGTDSIKKLDWLDPCLPDIRAYIVGIRMVWNNGISTVSSPSRNENCSYFNKQPSWFTFRSYQYPFLFNSTHSPWDLTPAAAGLQYLVAELFNKLANLINNLLCFRCYDSYHF